MLKLIILKSTCFLVLSLLLQLVSSTSSTPPLLKIIFGIHLILFNSFLSFLRTISQILLFYRFFSSIFLLIVPTTRITIFSPVPRLISFLNIFIIDHIFINLLFRITIIFDTFTFLACTFFLAFFSSLSILLSSVIYHSFRSCFFHFSFQFFYKLPSLSTTSTSNANTYTLLHSSKNNTDAFIHRVLMELV